MWWFLGSLSVFLLICNALFPTQSDDLGAVAEGFAGMKRSYMEWNGRWGELLRVAFMGALAPSLSFVIINTLVGVTFIVSFFVLVSGRMPQTFDDAVILALLIFFVMFYGSFASIFLWAAGSLNYLWAYLLLTLSLIPYRLYWGRYFRSYQNKQTFHQNPPKFSGVELLKALGFGILCFVAGMGSEIMGIVAIIVHSGFLVFALVRRGGVTPVVLCGCVLFKCRFCNAVF
ncbi:DUF6056 family protein [Helicobacter sp. MIT 14-3879]|uniref:DUF6056 family protein n=1 Tax=Helicobacter sp. MIT 14-3879 TaxID=2040649 RepID=UPI0015F1456D|nr:DUF6056 family protein [Helicobacter sp. MIT 14-3879]